MKNGLCTFFGHKYDEWHNSDENTCVETRTCVRCSHKKCRQSAHLFGEWDYELEYSCKQVKICLRCGVKVTRTLHEFGEWIEEGEESVKSYNRSRVCSRCGLVEYM